MLHAKELYKFERFYLDQEGTEQSKFALILYEDSEFVVTVIATSSKDHYNLNGNHGCYHSIKAGGQEHCYCFEANKVICENGFSFPLHTYLYTKRSIKNKSKNNLFKSGWDYKGMLLDSEYYELLYCLLCSEHVPQKYINLFEGLLESYYNSNS